MSNPNKNYINRAKALKKLGVIDYPLNSKLTTGQKSNITKKYKEFQQFFINPELFSIKHISNTDAKAFHDSGYKTVKTAKKTKLIIPIPANSTATYKKGKLIIDTPWSKETIMPSQNKDFIAHLDKISKQKRAKGEFLTLKIGDNQPFNRRFGNMNQLLNYVHNTKFRRDDAIRHLSIVELKRKTGENNEYIKRGKRKAKRSKKKVG